MRILVVGAGMYVTGRGGHGPGVLLAAIFEAARDMEISQVTVAAIREDNEGTVIEAVSRLREQLKTGVNVDYIALGDKGMTGMGAGVLASFDAGIVCVPDHLHFEISKQLLAAHMHVLVVKPLTPTLDEAGELVQLAAAGNLYGAVEFHKRYDQSNQYAQKALAENMIGDPLYAVVHYSQKKLIPIDMFRSWATRTNIAQYLGVHYIDLIWHLTHFRPQRVVAVGVKSFLTKEGIDTWDSVHATVEWEKPHGDTFVSQFNLNWIEANKSSAMSDQLLLIVGSEGRLDLDQRNRGVTLTTEQNGVSDVNPYFAEFLPGADGEQRFTGYGFESVRQFLQDVADLEVGRVTLDHLNGHRPSFQDALPSCAVIDALNRSLLSSGEWQEIKHAHV